MAVYLNKAILALLIIMLSSTIPVALEYERQPQMSKAIVAYGEIRNPDVANTFNWFDLVNTIAVYMSATGAISGSLVGLLCWFGWYKKHHINKTPVVAKLQD